MDEALGRYTVQAGDGSATILIADNVADQYPDIEDLLSDSISPGTGSKLPNLELSPPLRWATDDELPLSMEVGYDGFVIRRGCGEFAARCSATGVVQVILESELVSGAPGLPSESVWIDSPRPRPVDSVSYVEPGPLSIRGQHDVLWTGDEMIVWGGADGDNLPTLTDGAAFNPETAEWRMLPPFPIDRATVSRAVWADTRMIVTAAEGAFAYEPATDEWSAIGDGLFPSQYAGMTVWTGDVVAAWTAAGIYTFDPAIGTWSQLPDPGGGAGDRWDSALRVVDGTLYAIGSAGYCGGRRAARWAGDAWVLLPRVELDGGEYADCAYPNQVGVAGDRLVAWEDNIHETKAYDPDTDTWLPIDTIPLDGTEGPSGPLQLANGFLVPQYGEAAIFDEVSGDWYHVILPGSGENTEMVWTGYEVLMWGQPCCYGDGRDGFISMDAWRWTPPDADGTD